MNIVLPIKKVNLFFSSSLKRFQNREQTAKANFLTWQNVTFFTLTERLLEVIRELFLLNLFEMHFKIAPQSINQPIDELFILYFNTVKS